MKGGLINYREALVGRLRVLKSCFVLDAGTGAGNLTKALSDGLDLSVVSIDMNKRVFPHVFERVDRKRVEFVTCSFTHLPFKQDGFCAIVCDLAISTSSDWKPFSIYGEFRRVLKHGSSLYITDYFPERSPRTKEALLAVETSRLLRTILKTKGVKLKRGFSPQSTVRQLKRTGFVIVKREKIKANEGQAWKKRVLEEYYNGMKMEISTLSKPNLQVKYMKKLEELKREIENEREICWGWGVNYVIQAQK